MNEDSDSDQGASSDGSPDSGSNRRPFLTITGHPVTNSKPSDNDSSGKDDSRGNSDE